MFGIEVEAAARAYALATWPEECCGIVERGVFLPLPNEAEDRRESFRLPARVWIEHHVEAVVHSHVVGRHPRWPSAADMQGQIASAVPWGIVWTSSGDASGPLWWGDFVLDDPLLGREFEPGIRDCYGLVRAAFWQMREVKLPEFARDDQWWNKGGDLLREGFPSAGFAVVHQGGGDGALRATRPGDVVLMAIRSGETPNHCGIVLEDGLVLHHLANRLSRREPLGPWAGHVTHVLRYR